MQIIQPIKQILYSLCNKYIQYCLHYQASVTTLSFLMSALVLIYVINDIMTERQEKYIKDEIPQIIELSKNVQNIENYIEQTLDIFPNDLPIIGESITKETQLTTSQLNFLKFIDNLKIYQEKWDTYAFDQLIHVTNIESPYRIAHRIRTLLEIPLVMNLDKTDIDVWLTKEEENCLRNYETKLMKPISNINKTFTPETPVTPVSECSDHIVICIRCKELINEEEAEKIILKKHACEVVEKLKKQKNVEFDLEKSTNEAINEIANSLNNQIGNFKDMISKKNIAKSDILTA